MVPLPPLVSPYTYVTPLGENEAYNKRCAELEYEASSAQKHASQLVNDKEEADKRAALLQQELASVGKVSSCPKSTSEWE